jgi:NCAIR mutase (PurE)-related protein
MTIQPKMKHRDVDSANTHGSNLLSFANIDYKRAKRTGFPEAIFAQGKTPYQIVSILDSMAAASQSSSPILATRVDNSLYQSITQLLPIKHGDITYHETARIISMKPHTISSTNNDTQTNPNKKKKVIVACAGTTDIAVAEEAAVTLELVRAGNTNSKSSSITVERIYDVGVAGLHRILNRLEDLQSADCIIVCAGMDGALPSVVGGLVSAPVIACPTSVGYGASFHGVSALLTMLNSCSPGVGVVNIDNGFGAAALAFKCIQPRDP